MTPSYEAGVEAHFLKDRIGTDIAVYENVPNTRSSMYPCPMNPNPAYWRVLARPPISSMTGLVVNKGDEKSSSGSEAYTVHHRLYLDHNAHGIEGQPGGTRGTEPSADT